MATNSPVAAAANEARPATESKVAGRFADGIMARNCWPKISKSAEQHLKLRAELVSRGYPNFYYCTPKDALEEMELFNAGYAVIDGDKFSISRGGFNYLAAVKP